MENVGAITAGMVDGSGWLACLRLNGLLDLKKPVEGARWLGGALGNDLSRALKETCSSCSDEMDWGETDGESLTRPETADPVKGLTRCAEPFDTFGSGAAS